MTEPTTSLASPLAAGLLFLGATALMVMAISTFAFSRMTMVRIERQMRRDGLPRPAPWDEMGMRLVWYACIIVFSAKSWNEENHPFNLFIDVSVVRQYAGRFDRILGAFFLASVCLFTTIAVSFAWLR